MAHETLTLVAAPNDLTADAARDLTDQIRTGLEGVYQWIKAAYRGRAWIALGYESWDEYVTREFGNLHLRPPREDRSDVIQSMRASGMSVRAIASATDLSHGTVSNELSSAGVQKWTPKVSPTVQGQDGKEYPASRPPRPAPTVAADDVEPALEQSSVDDVLDRPASEFGITPLDLEVRAGEERDRVSRLLREFDGSGSAALPMTIKLASQVSGLVSPLNGESSVPDERLHDVAYTASRAVRTLANVLVRLATRAQGQHAVEMRSNVRDTVDELNLLLDGMEEA